MDVEASQHQPTFARNVTMNYLSVEVPIVFQAEVKKGREVNFRDTFFGEKISVEIPVFDTSEACLAATWKNCEGDDLVDRQLWLIDNDFYMPVYTSETKSDIMGKDELFTTDDATYASHLLVGQFAHHQHPSVRNAFRDFIHGRLNTGTLDDYKAVAANQRETHY